MKIGLLIYGSLDTISGGYIYDHHLVEYLRAQGESVEIISIPWRNYLSHLRDNFSESLRSRLVSLEVDALIQDELCHPSLFHLNQQLRGIVSYPIISLVHHLRCSEDHPSILNTIYRAVERKYLNSVDGFIFNSRTTKAAVAEHVQRLPANVTAFPGGDGLKEILTETVVRQRALAQRPLRLIFLGSVTRRKGLHTLLDACEQHKRSLIEITIIGSQSAEPRYTRQIQARISCLKNRFPIKILDALPAESIPEELRHQDILVVPSSYEGFGIVYLEGMAFGLPAIATTSGAAHETIQHNHNGFLIQPGDSATLKNHILTLVKNRDELLRLSLNALNTHQNGPTWKGMAKNIHQFLTSLPGIYD